MSTGERRVTNVFAKGQRPCHASTGHPYVDVSATDLDRLQELNKQIARLLADAEALNNEARLLARRIYGERETE